MTFDLNFSVQRGIDVNPTNRDSHITTNNFEVLLGDSLGFTTFNTLNSNNVPVVSINSDGYLSILGKFSVNGSNQTNSPYITLSDLTTSSSLFLLNINPDGVVTGTKGSAGLNYQDGYIYSNFDGATKWKRYATIDEVGSGNGNAVQKLVEIDLGPLPIYETTINIIDPEIMATNSVAVSMSNEIPTGKDPDEVSMDSYALYAFAKNGSFDLYIRGLEGYISDTFKIIYSIGD